MEIVKQGNSKPMDSIYFVCTNCGCEFVCDGSEYESETGTSGVICYSSKCPCCGKKVWKSESDEDEEVFTIDNPPKYPDDFFHFANKATAKISDEKVNDWIRESLSYFKKNPEERYYEIMCGDTYLQVQNFDDGIHIIVCKNHHVADIEPE